MSAVFVPCCSGSTLFVKSSAQRSAFRQRPCRVLCTAVRPDKTKLGEAGAVVLFHYKSPEHKFLLQLVLLLNVLALKQFAGAATNVPEQQPEQSIFSTVDDAGSASIGRYAKSPARPDAYVAQTALAPASVPILDLNSETLSGHNANRIALRDLIGADGAHLRTSSCSPRVHQDINRVINWCSCLAQVGRRASSVRLCRGACCESLAGSCL